MKSSRLLLGAVLSLLMTTYGCASEEEPVEDEHQQTEDNLSFGYKGRVDHAGVVESTTMMLKSFMELDSYNRQDPFNINPALHAEAFKSNFIGYDGIDGVTDWTPENMARWVTRMSTGNYLVVDLSKSCAFGKPSYLDIEREQMFGTPHTTCGGRTPSEDALDVTYNLLIRGKPEKAADIGDGVDELHKAASPTFPYLAGPN